MEGRRGSNSGHTVHSRRDFLRLATAGAAGAWLPTVAALPRSRLRAGPQQVEPDVRIALRAVPASAQILPGPPTDVWRYEAEVVAGDASHVQQMPGSYLGPTIRVRRGQRVRVRLENELSEETIVHWHGLHVPAEADGHPRFAVGHGERFDYEFDVKNPAGTYWYHPHPHRRTGPQVNAGLAGLFIVSDDDEAALDLPEGAYDLPLVIQDRAFDSGNQFVYSAGMTRPGMMGGMGGFLGDRILVNGMPDAHLTVEPRPYRLRLLNGSSSRIYKLAWDDRRPVTVIATGGGLLDEPVLRDYVTLAPGERMELLEDFGAVATGDDRVLQSLAFSGMANFAPVGVPPNGASFDVLRVRVEMRADMESIYLPHAANGIEVRQASDIRDRRADAPAVGSRLAAADGPSEAARTIELAGEMTPGMPGGSMRWTLDGRTFEMEGVAPEDVVRSGATEAWDFVNVGMTGMVGMGGQGMGMPHPIHVHGVSFKVVEREVEPRLMQHWETVAGGFVDEGLKDTVLVMPGERVRVRMTLPDDPGLFLYHCHNLEHEDAGMMRNFRVE